jgi:hypothetical protein
MGWAREGSGKRDEADACRSCDVVSWGNDWDGEVFFAVYCVADFGEDEGDTFVGL